MREIYIADDGKMFETCAECVEYERTAKAKDIEKLIACGDIQLWNGEYNEYTSIYHDTPWGGVESVFSQVKFVTIRSDEAVEALNDHCEYWGIQCPSYTGSWIYDNDISENWVLVEEYYRDTLKDISFCRTNGLLPNAE